MTKARELLEILGPDFEYDYGYVGKGVAGHDIGKLTLDDGVGIIEIDLPIDDVDPDSTHVAVPLNFTYDEVEGDISYVSLKMDVSKYIAADDGNPHDLPQKGKSMILDYLKSNKAKLEKALEDFADAEVKKAREKAREDDFDYPDDRPSGREYGRYEPYNYGTKHD